MELTIIIKHDKLTMEPLFPCSTLTHMTILEKKSRFLTES